MGPAATDWNTTPEGEAAQAAYTALMSLIRGKWWTQATGRTDPDGVFTHRVFYGDYTLTVTNRQGHTRTQTVTASALPHTVTVRLP